MDHKMLLSKELSNIYAIYKQVNKFLDGSDIHFLSEQHQLLLMDYLKTLCKSEEDISNMLVKLQFNPTNTVDSIIEEITENLREITNQDISEQVKSSGYRMSMNRLLAYQIANLENAQHIGDGLLDTGAISEMISSTTSIKERLWN